MEVVFETHSTSEDNERGVASGWAHSRLSATGREQARAMGARRRRDGIDVVACSDLERAVETTRIALEGSDVPVLLDWRLRECDYGELTQAPTTEHHAHRGRYVDEPYPGGESWRQATSRVARAISDLQVRWGAARVLIVGHLATRWGLDHHVNGVPLEDLVLGEFEWQEGWEYVVRSA